MVDSSKCLGVTISEDLTWRKHVESTVNKANKTLGFIQRNLGDCTVAVKSAACTRGYEQQTVKKEEIRLGFQGGKAPCAKWTLRFWSEHGSHFLEHFLLNSFSFYSPQEFHRIRSNSPSLTTKLFEKWSLTPPHPRKNWAGVPYINLMIFHSSPTLLPRPT